MEDIKKIEAEYDSLRNRVYNDIHKIIRTHDRVDFCDEDGEIVFDLAVGALNAETKSYPNVNAVVLDEKRGIIVQCDLLGSDYEISLDDIELSLGDLVGILKGMHEILKL